MEPPIERDDAAVRAVDVAVARAVIARLVLDGDGESTQSATRISLAPENVDVLGEITLRAHQLSAVRRLRAALSEFGGAILCDQVGMGKTFVALAVARESSVVLVVAPAVLREMWMQASRKSGRNISFWSFETLSRGRSPDCNHDFLIVDEAHHARNPATQRYVRLATLAARSPVLLLSATPVHNRKKDFVALIALFLGARAHRLAAEEIARCTVRRDREAIGSSQAIPIVEPTEWCEIPHEDSIPPLILALPPPLPPRDGGDGGVLIAHSLVRQWASSDAALAGGIRRRLQKAVSLVAALESGVYPSSSELRAWTAIDDAVQLAFPSLIAPPTNSSAELLSAVVEHQKGLELLRLTLRDSHARDVECASVLRQLRKRHPGTGIVAFSQYADTVQVLFKHLASDGEVAALTGRGGRVAGGTISRTEVIARFAPIASGMRAPRPADVVSLLLTTDLLSEGVNLQDAGVVVHLDLPWTPARIEQRVGRIARIGSPHDRVFCYAFRPPASADAVIRLEHTLEAKQHIAAGTVGGFPSILPGHDFVAPRVGNPPAINESIRALLDEWAIAAKPGGIVEAIAVEPRAGKASRHGDRTLADRLGPMHKVAHKREEVVVAELKIDGHENPVKQERAQEMRGTLDAGYRSISVAAVCAPVEGFIAAFAQEEGVRLLVSRHGNVTENPACVLELMRMCSGPGVTVGPDEIQGALRTARSFITSRNAFTGTSRAAAAIANMRRGVLLRISAVAGRARPHMRAKITLLAEEARSAALAELGIASERQLSGLASAELQDEAWLRRVIELGRVARTRRVTLSMTERRDGGEVLALILLRAIANTRMR